MPIRFDLLADAGALPPTQTDADMEDLELDHDEYGEYIVDRTVARDDVNKDAPAALKVTANCYERFARTCTGEFVVHAGRIAGVFGFCFGLVVLIFWAAEPRMFHIDFGDWFFWTVWTWHAFALCVAFLSRMTGRCWRVNEGRVQALDIGSTPYKIFTRDPFSGRCEGLLVGTCNGVQAAVVIVSMFLIMQAMLQENNYQHELKLAWTMAYLCQSLAVWLQILSDVLSLYLVYARSVYCPFLLSAIASVFACFFLPIFTIGYALYCAACCSGTWSGLIF